MYGLVPVHVFDVEGGRLRALALDWSTGQLEPRPEYLLEIEFDRSGQARQVRRGP